MTTRKSYSCNLCHGSAPEGSAVGLCWTGERRMEITATLGNAETHICEGCLRALEAALYYRREKERKNDEFEAANGSR